MSTTKSAKPAAPSRRARWLTKDQEAAWRSLAAVMVHLPWALECQLQHDADLSFIEYHALAMLSEQTEHTLRMSELAQLTNASLSRLSHLVKRLERRGYIRREPDPVDGRYTLAMLTDTGYQHLVDSAPGHVEAVRRLVIDVVSESQLRAIHKACQQILTQLAPKG